MDSVSRDVRGDVLFQVVVREGVCVRPLAIVLLLGQLDLRDVAGAGL